MAERRIIMNNKVENFEWHSLLDLSGKGLHKFNAVGKDMTCSQLMNNAGLDWNVEMKEVHFQDNKGRYIDNFLLKTKFALIVSHVAVEIVFYLKPLASRGNLETTIIH